MNVREFLEDRVSKNAEKTYLCFQDQEVTYSEFDRRVNKTANGLWSMGLRKGDHFAIMLPNCPEFLYTWFGLNKIGAVEVPINTQLKEAEVQYILDHSEVKGIVTNSTHLPLVKNIQASVPALEHVVLVGEESAAMTIPYQDWLAGASEETPPEVSVSETDAAVIIYTSGTTGRPKGVLLSHRTWVETGVSWAFTVGAKPSDRIMTPMPFFHANAQVYSTMGSLAAGACLILIEKFSRSRILEQARHYRANRLVIGAPIIPMIWSRPPEGEDGDNPIEVIQAGGVPTEYFYDFEKRFQVKVQTLYSLTESPTCIMGPREGARPRKITPGIGYPMEHPDPGFENEVRIIDEQGQDLPHGTVGEIIVRNPAVMIGYFKDPEKTAETKRDGWIHTGDRGYRDEDGYFFFVGRSKDVIRRKAELVSPAEIESVINRHPKVQDSAVIGVPSGLGIAEEDIKAYVSLRPGDAVSPEEIIDWCRQNLADFKVPRYLEFRDDLPRTPVGKIQKAVLKAEKDHISEGCYDREKGV